MLFLKLSQAQAIRTVFEDIMRIQMAPDFFYQRAQSTVYHFAPIFFLSVCYLISTIIDFCIPGRCRSGIVFLTPTG